jgi:hypothetical protein
MSRWIEGLTRLPLAESGRLLSDPERASLTDEMTQALKVDVPVLRFLRASELVTAEVASEDRLWLVFQLAETTQPALILSGDARRRCFLEEVQKARTQLESVEWRIREAMGEGRAPGDSVLDGPDEASTRAIRERIRRHSRGGQLLIPGVPICRRIEVGSVPATLARGPRLKISARVVSMTRTRAELRNVVVDSADMQRALTIPGLAECKEVVRDLRNHHLAIGEVLRQAMDAESRIDINVMVVLDWASGTALRFQTHT